MKRIILAIAILLIAVTASASPYLVSDNQSAATSYRITGGPAWLPATFNGSALRVDLANYQQGAWPIKVRACRTDPLYGVQCSAETEYTLTCPSPTGGLNKPVLSISP